MQRETLLLNATDVEQNAPMSEVVPAVEDAFAAFQRGDAQMPAKSYIELPQYNGDFRSMPAYLDAGTWDAAGIKWVNVHTDNRDHFDLPTVLGTMIYSDPETAFPLAILDGRELTMQRTGAAAAVATDYLAVPDASSLGIVGAGVQSYTQLEAISQVRPIETVVVADRDDTRVTEFIEAFDTEFDVHAGSISDAAGCDVLSTVTPVEDPIIPREAVGDHTHINAMGADAPGKHELADEILFDAMIIIDDHEQTIHSGEINVLWRANQLDESDINASIGEVVLNQHQLRDEKTGISVFDSTGLAVQDVATAHVVYEHACANDNGYNFDLLGFAGAD